jgi:hypothetical protein
MSTYTISHSNLKTRSNFNPVFIGIASFAGLLLGCSCYVFAASLVPVYISYPLLTSLVLCPYSVYARWRLQALDGFIEVENRIRSEVNRLTRENGRLRVLVNKMERNVSEFEEQNKELKASVEGLSHVEESLADLASESGVNVDLLRELVYENRLVLENTKMVQSQTQRLCDSMSVQNLMSLVLKCDVDNSGDFTDMELRLIAGGMRGLEPGFQEDVFFSVLRKRREAAGGKRNTLSGLMEVVRNMMDEDVPDDQRIVKKRPKMKRPNHRGPQ